MSRSRRRVTSMVMPFSSIASSTLPMNLLRLLASVFSASTTTVSRRPGGGGISRERRRREAPLKSMRGSRVVAMVLVCSSGGQASAGTGSGRRATRRSPRVDLGLSRRNWVRARASGRLSRPKPARRSLKCWPARSQVARRISASCLGLSRVAARLGEALAQRQRAGHERCRLRRARGEAVAAVEPRGVDLGSRRHQVHLVAPRGVVRHLAGLVDGADGDHAGQRARVVERRGAVVAGGGHHAHAVGKGGANHVDVREAAALVLDAEAHVDHVGALLHGVADTGVDVVDQAGADQALALAQRAEHAHGQNATARGDAFEHAPPLGDDDAGDVRAVADAGVGGVGVGVELVGEELDGVVDDVDEVEATDQAVGVFRMVGLHPGIEHGDRHVRVAGGDAVRLGESDRVAGPRRRGASQRRRQRDRHLGQLGRVAALDHLEVAQRVDERDVERRAVHADDAELPVEPVDALGRRPPARTDRLVLAHDGRVEAAVLGERAVDRRTRTGDRRRWGWR